MPKLYRATVPVEWPATAADLRRARSGKGEVVTTHTDPDDGPIEAPYPEIVPSWLANGFEEVI